jgi:UDPglucose 6-dehydrogenase/UDP-N-acetyl-D-galactosamine dehydrogenase
VLGDCDVIIIAVPTPITKSKEPDLSFVISAAELVGKYMKPNVIVVLESTVYPGVTEEVLGPTLAKTSGLKCGVEFTIGYSPERVNPGDPEHTIDKITKIVSGQDPQTAKILVELYSHITTVHWAESIQIAEAAKVIENVQRDLNIALVNELAIIFDRMDIDAHAVLRAAGSKWNFHSYKPGLVGGHCIPVDPYYLVHKAKLMGYNPQVILAGRAVNDAMPEYVFDLTLQALNSVKKPLNGVKLLIMGLTFKENVADTRENPVHEVIRLLHSHGAALFGYDPLLSYDDVKAFDIQPVDFLNDVQVDGIIMTVVHDAFKSMQLTELKEILADPGVLIDVRGHFNKEDAEEHGFVYKTL